MRLALCSVGVLVGVLSSVGSARAQPAAQPPPASPPPAAYPPPPYPPGAYPPVAAYPPPPLPAPAPPVAEKKLGLGYKIGNGLGFVGADLIVAPIEHIAVDLQANYISYGGATGSGFAFAGQGRLKGGQQSTPYLGLGWVHASLTLGGETGSASGFFANVGYEWRWDSGLGIILGGGLSHIGAVTVVSGGSTVMEKGGWLPNIEAGLRYMFL